jgi:hypothetical protein
MRYRLQYGVSYNFFFWQMLKPSVLAEMLHL